MDHREFNAGFADFWQRHHIRSRSTRSYTTGVWAALLSYAVIYAILFDGLFFVLLRIATSS